MLRVSYNNGPTGDGLSPQTGAELVRSLQAYAGVTVIPIYTKPGSSSLSPSQDNNGTASGAPHSGPRVGANPAPDDSIISCASLQQLPVLGTCAPGVDAVDVNALNILFTDNPLFVTKNLPIVHPNSPTASDSLTTLSLGALLLKTDNGHTLEKVRTRLTAFNASVTPGGELSAWQKGNLEPETFGEVAQIRNNDANNIERVILVALGLTLLVAGCSLAVTVGGSLVERRREFTLLRLSGAPTSSLHKVVLLESALPLVTASLVAAATGFGITIPLIKSVLPKLASTVFPTPIYYVTMGSGLAVSLLVVSATLPLLNRITAPSNARFE